VYKSVGARFLPLLTKQMDIFRLKIFANMPKIQNIMESFIKFVFRAFEVTVILGQRMWSVLGIVWDFLKKLDDATGGWSTKILGLIALWKALNLSFIATPLGALLTGLLGILALYDDFKVFQSGGESFFNWAPFLPVINAVKDALSGVKSMLDAISFIVFGLIDSFVKLFHLDFAGFKETMKNLWGDIIALIQRTISTIGDFLSVGGAVKNWAVGIFSGNAQAQPTLPPRTGLGNTQHVSQETNINVSGSADASATGKAVAGEQSRVNFDMTRNLLGATR